MGSDRLLWGIVGGIVLLIVVALGVAAAGPGTQYRPDDSPTNVVFNYVAALQKGDYERAYGYLDPTIGGYPDDVAEFEADTQGYEFNQGRNVRYSVVSERVAAGDANATVRVEAEYGSAGLFDPSFASYTSDFTMQLAQTDDGWKIIDGDSLFFYCWSSEDQPYC